MTNQLNDSLLGEAAKLTDKIDGSPPLKKGEFKCRGCKVIGKNVEPCISTIGWVAVAGVAVLTFLIFNWIFTSFFWVLVGCVIIPVLFYKLYAEKKWLGSYKMTCTKCKTKLPITLAEHEAAMKRK